MASLLDLAGLKHFSGLFPFLLVLVLVYAILSRTDFFKEKPVLVAIISFIMAIMTLYSRIAIKTINLMAPWFVLFIIFGILLVLAFMTFGISQEQVSKFVFDDNMSVGMWVLTIILLIGVGSLIAVMNEEKTFSSLTEGNNVTAEPSQDYGFWQTIFHQKILGMVLVLLIAFFTIRQVSKTD